MPGYWGIHLGSGGKFAEIGRNNGFVAIGWEELGDLTSIATAGDSGSAQQKLRTRYEAAFGVTGLKASIGVGQIWRFIREIAVGDFVFVPHSSKGVVYVGRVTGALHWVEHPTDGCEYQYRRTVEWLKDVSRTEIAQPLLFTLGSLLAVFSLAKRTDEAAAIVTGLPVVPGAHVATANVLLHIRKRLISLKPPQFEQFVTDFLEGVGYSTARVGRSGDGGIDVEGSLNAQGLAQVLLRVQVKRTMGSVGNEVVLKTRGALAVDEQGAIVTLGGFTSAARKEAEATGKKSIMLVDGEQFVGMVLENWGRLNPDMQVLLGVRPRVAIPVPILDRFDVVAE